MASDNSPFLFRVASLGRGRIGATLSMGPRRRLKAVVGAKSLDESLEEYGQLLIKPDPSCPECSEIMLWRSAHRLLGIANGKEIRVSDTRWGNRHLHVREVRVAHLNKVRQQREEAERIAL